MSKFLIVLTGLIYTYVAGEQYFKTNIGGSLMFLGYALANVGVYLSVQ